jgi:hypothetical protein
MAIDFFIIHEILRFELLNLFVREKNIVVNKKTSVHIYTSAESEKLFV